MGGLVEKWLALLIQQQKDPRFDPLTRQRLEEWLALLIPQQEGPDWIGLIGQRLEEWLKLLPQRRRSWVQSPA